VVHLLDHGHAGRAMKLRPYQREAIEHVTSRWSAGDVRVPIVLATGLGKTQIFTSLADEWLAVNPGRRALIIAHTDELISQAVKRMKQVAPGRRVGRVQGQMFNETLAEIVVSSRQTLAREARRNQIRNVGLIIIDECHHAIRTNTSGKILEHYGAFDDPAPVHVLGVTATLARGDKEKLSTVWQECVFSRDILFGIRHGYLLDVRGERIIVPDLDLSRVRISGGDYSERDLGDELERTFAPEVIAKEYARLAVSDDKSGVSSRIRRGIAFWPLVDIAHHGADAFNAEGIRSGVVSGLTPKPERRALLQRFNLPLAHPEAIDVMHNAMVLTEGFDEPTADVVVIARPTRSAPLFQQMVGRVLRPDLTVAPELRQKALILDVHGSGQEHGLRTLIDLSPDRRRGDAEVPDDLSLSEIDEWLEEQLAEDLEAQRAGAGMIVESDEYRGPVKTETFDPLGRDKVWGSTPAGYHFISAGGVAYVFLAPSIDGDPGTWDVVTCSKNNYVRDGVIPWVAGPKQYDIEPGLPLEMALNWGEDIAVRVGGPGTLTLNRRKSAWRKAEPTEPQKRYAAALRLSLTREDGTPKNKGEINEEIDSVNAARRIDPLVAQVVALKAMRDESDKQKEDM
jgi:superfamily II DNA or RNA helicase